MDLEDLKSKLFGAAEAVIMSMDRPETLSGSGGEASPSQKLAPGRFRAFTKKNRFRASPWGAPSRNLLGSFCSLSSFGSSQELTDLQEDAKCRRISSEIFKHRLYETVLCRGPARRRCLSANIGEEEKDVDLYPVRYVQSVPTTPIYSSASSPIQSPRTTRRGLLGLSKQGGRGSNKNIAEHNGEKYKGLACILQRDSSTDSDDLDSLGDLELDSDLDIDLHIEEDFDVNTKKGEQRLSPFKNSQTTNQGDLGTMLDTNKTEQAFEHDDKLSSSLPGLKMRCKGIVTRDMLDGCMYS